MFSDPYSRIVKIISFLSPWPLPALSSQSPVSVMKKLRCCNKEALQYTGYLAIARRAASVSPLWLGTDQIWGGTNWSSSASSGHLLWMSFLFWVPIPPRRHRTHRIIQENIGYCPGLHWLATSWPMRSHFLASGPGREGHLPASDTSVSGEPLSSDLTNWKMIPISPPDPYSKSPLSQQQPDPALWGQVVRAKPPPKAHAAQCPGRCQGWLPSWEGRTSTFPIRFRNTRKLY